MSSLMLEEALSAPDAVARQLAADPLSYARLGQALQEQPPTSVLTIARGSSEHAAHYLAYLVMARLGRKEDAARELAEFKRLQGLER